MVDAGSTVMGKKNHVPALMCLWPGPERWHVISPKCVYEFRIREKHSFVSITNGNWPSV